MPGPARRRDGPTATPTSLRQQLLPVLALVAGFLVVATALLYHVAGQQNLVAESVGRHLAHSATTGVRDEVKAFVRDYAYWSDTAQNVVVAYDPDWARDNVGRWVIENLGMDGSLVLGGGNRIIHDAATDDATAAALRPSFPGPVANLIAAARRHAGPPGDGPTAVSGFIRTGERVHIAAAATIKWEEDRPPPRADGAPAVLLFYRTFDDAVLADLESRYLLDGLRLISADTDSSPPVHLSVASVGGDTLARLTWNVEQPGTRMLERLAMPLGGGVLVLLGVLTVIVRRAQRTARTMQNYHTELEAKADELARARDDAHSANRAKSEFLAVMSHELRTPLNAVIGFSDILRTPGTRPAETERIEEYAGYIHDSGVHLLSIINDILDLSKIEAGRYELRDGTVDLDEVMAHCTTLIERRAAGRGMSLVYEPRGWRVQADRRALTQILLNLLTNAVKYATAETTVGIDIRRDADGLVMAVRDEGPGMTPEEIPHAMSAFGQVETAHVRNTEGTGLGLNISQRLAELHGGTLAIDSAVGRGTTVEIRLPADRILSRADTTTETA